MCCEENIFVFAVTVAQHYEVHIYIVNICFGDVDN